MIELRDLERKNLKKALPLLFKREMFKEKKDKIKLNLKKKEYRSKKKKSEWFQFIKSECKHLR